MESEIERGLWKDTNEAERTTLKTALERYAKEVSSKKNGALQESYRIKRIMEHESAKLALARITSAHVAKFRDGLAGEGLAPATIVEHLAILSHLFSVASRDWGIHVANPVKNVRKPAMANERNRRLEADEEERLMAALARCRNSYMLSLSRFALETACRQSELLRLRWTDIDVKRRVALIRETKNGEPRAVPLLSVAP